MKYFEDYPDYFLKFQENDDIFNNFKYTYFEKTEGKDPDVGIAQGVLTFMVYVKVPGFNKKDIDLSIEGDELVIQTECDHKFFIENETIIQDFKINDINKRVKIPESFVKGEVKAFLEDGILKVYIKKNKDFTKIIEIE